MQVVSLSQTTASRLDPVGIELVGVQVEKSFVLTEVALPPSATPTATQLEELEQATEESRSTDG
jgi:hypothetical protein